ncbi:glycine--tRNA ligase subunit beta [Thiohalocapsa marina]|uniref:Glycine--tRNA ligase beta subunit n=1 Tax=Thiohalocapsa marina TaxID=424902 RepID=A0A5M8FUH4_9GAMM|nr:glycine--tRNA ligase subunit beta [Thiohalocapsa marina]
MLVEIGTEELPPTALKRLSEAFADQLSTQLTEQRIGHGNLERFAAPRRLAVIIQDVQVRQPDQETLRRGPALAAAFDAQGQPSKAALGFARSCGVEVDALDREQTDKGEWLCFRQQATGERTLTLLPALVEAALGRLPIPRRMRWGDGDAEFVRPVHWVCGLLGAEPVPGRVLGLDIGTGSRGHRFHHPDRVQIPRPEAYAEALRAASVEPSLELRRQAIREQVLQLAASVHGHADLPDDLLDEVAALCEWPTALLGRFDADFLQVPAEVLIETMQKNQKYFPVFDDTGALMPWFITIANIRSRDPDLVRAGNERVIRPRFADARFFWEQDRKTPLADRRDALGSVVFQHKLGSLLDKSRRVAGLSRHIAGLLDYDQDEAERAAELAKCDLVTAMVGEFASLQGTMGRYYAQHDGERPGVVAAMEEQYLPRHAGDRLPTSDAGRTLALADKLDTLVGIFAIGQRPTGVKDPYGLRRAAIGVLRILIETPLALDLKDLLWQAAFGYRGVVEAEDAVTQVFDYMMERLPGYYGDMGVAAEVVDAVLSLGPQVPSDIDRRILAVAAFRQLEAAEALSAANKRIRNILKKSGDGIAADIDTTVRPEGLQEEAERRLAQGVEQMRARLAPMHAAQDYEGMLRTLAGLREDVDQFFDQVMVMTDDAELRRNRLALLRSLEQLFLLTADISRLH